MKLYRFSPIRSKEQLLEAIRHIHFSCCKLCFQSFGTTLPNSGNMGVFCHYPEEYTALTKVRQELTEPSDNPDRKYFCLYTPLVVAATATTPETTYTHLYIRKPDPYRHQVGDVDFFLESDKYCALKRSLLTGTIIPGARVFERPDLDMVELYDPDIDALAYVSTNKVSQEVRIKIKKDDNFPLKLASPARRALAQAGYIQIEQLTLVTEKELKQLHGMGPHALKQLREALQAQGLSFKE